MQDESSLDELIAFWEAQQKKAGEVLPHLRAAKAALSGSKARRVRKVIIPRSKTRPKKAGSNAFQPKYNQPSRVLIAQMLDELGADHRGLTATAIRTQLAEGGHLFSAQAIMFALKKLLRRSRIKRVPAHKGVRGTWVYKANPAHSLTEDELREELGAAN